MPETTVALLNGLANVIIAAAALGVATLLALRIIQQSTVRREPLGIAFCLVFLAVSPRPARTEVEATTMMSEGVAAR